MWLWTPKQEGMEDGWIKSHHEGHSGHNRVQGQTGGAWRAALPVLEQGILGVGLQKVRGQELHTEDVHPSWVWLGQGKEEPTGRGPSTPLFARAGTSRIVFIRKGCKGPEACGRSVCPTKREKRQQNDGTSGPFSSLYHCLGQCVCVSDYSRTSFGGAGGKAGFPVQQGKG